VLNIPEFEPLLPLTVVAGAPPPPEPTAIVYVVPGVTVNPVPV
jgi:hypothetical protein